MTLKRALNIFLKKQYYFIMQFKTLLIIIILLIIFLFFLLFNDFNFLSGQNLEQAKDTSSADVIVVLTGSSDRIKKGFELLEYNYSKRMFISGVNPIVRKNDLKKIIDLENSIEKNNLFTCCVFLGKDAKNTKTNALEARMDEKK